MKLVCDIECNSLVRPSRIHLAVCRNVDSGELHIFRNLTENDDAKRGFCDLTRAASRIIGHNWLGYDHPICTRLLGADFQASSDCCVDTLLVSKIVNYSRPGGHSIEQYGEEFGSPKHKFNDWTKWSQQMEDYCVQDVRICDWIYRRYLDVIDDPNWAPALRMEHQFQLLCNDLHDNGFFFDVRRARDLLGDIEGQLAKLDAVIAVAFPPREEVIREFTPKPTKFGTISKTSVPRSLWDRIHEYEVGRCYQHTREVPFNPDSHKQRIEVLNAAGWVPIHKTDTHARAELDCARLKREGGSAYRDAKRRLDTLSISGWKIDETNLNTLPETAPEAARSLARRILLEARRRTLTEWLDLVQEDGRIHGHFYGIGAWTHRMAHRNPNTANIPREFHEDGTPKLLGREMRSLWRAPKNRLLVGVDAEGIQLRIFAHYINDKEFTDALVKGTKSDKTDPHSFNQRILGPVCRTRQAAKRFLYALLLGAGVGKLRQILGCSESECRDALNRLLERLTGFRDLKERVIPRDARKGWFIGVDGRRILLPGGSERDRGHLCMSGYLQAGEAIVMKRAALLWYDQLRSDTTLGRWLFVNMVHDEWQTECKNSLDVATRIAKVQADALKTVGEELRLNCPMAGSYWNEDIRDYTIGVNWYQTH